MSIAYEIKSIVRSAGMSTKTPVSNPYSKRLDAYLSKLKWMNNSFSDSFALVYVYKKWVQKYKSLEFRGRADEKRWERDNLVQANVMKEICNLVDEIQRRLRNSGIVANLEHDFLQSEISMDRALFLKIAIAGAFYPNYFLRSRPKEAQYLHDVAKELSCRNPLNTVAFHGTPNELPFNLYKWHFTNKFRSFDGQEV